MPKLPRKRRQWVSTVHVRSIIPRVGRTSDRRTFPCSIINYTTCLLDFDPGWRTPTKSHKNTEKLQRDSDRERERERERSESRSAVRERQTQKERVVWVFFFFPPPKEKYSQKRKSWRERERERGGGKETRSVDGGGKGIGVQRSEYKGRCG